MTNRATTGTRDLAGDWYPEDAGGEHATSIRLPGGPDNIIREPTGRFSAIGGDGEPPRLLIPDHDKWL